MNIEPVQRVLDSLRVPYALIGAHAMAARGYPRFTVDIALLTTSTTVLASSPWAELVRGGARVEPRRGDEDDPLAGVVHIMLSDDTDIDLVVGRWKWEADVIERAERMEVAPGVVIGVPRTSDLILLKLAAGGVLDLHDAAALLAVSDRATVVGEVDQRIGLVQPDVRDAWRNLRAAG